MKINPNSKLRGFTLIEILIALTISSVVMGMVIFMVMSSMDMRKKAIRLNTAIYLAEKMMDEIKNDDSLVDKSGDLESNPGFSYAYSMNEIEYDPLSGLSDSEKDKEQKILEEHRLEQSSELSTGLSFKMRRYNVTLFYQNKELYELECLRGLKIEQTTK